MSLAKHLIIGNHGNETIALMQWAHEAKLTTVDVLSVDTGWASPTWPQRVVAAKQLAERYLFKVHRITPPKTFTTLAQEKGCFPQPKFAWCATFLKGTSINEWLDRHDPKGKLIVLLGLHQQPHDVDLSEHYGGRQVSCPFEDLESIEIQNLVSRSKFTWLTTRSQECYPCIYAQKGDLKDITSVTLKKVSRLERKLNVSMFPEKENIFSYLRHMKNHSKSTSTTAIGCGTYWGCGL